MHGHINDSVQNWPVTLGGKVYSKSDNPLRSIQPPRTHHSAFSLLNFVERDRQTIDTDKAHHTNGRKTHQRIAPHSSSPPLTCLSSSPQEWIGWLLVVSMFNDRYVVNNASHLHQPSLHEGKLLQSQAYMFNDKNVVNNFL